MEARANIDIVHDSLPGSSWDEVLGCAPGYSPFDLVPPAQLDLLDKDFVRLGPGGGMHPHHQHPWGRPAGLSSRHGWSIDANIHSQSRRNRLAHRHDPLTRGYASVDRDDRGGAWVPRELCPS